MESCFEGATNQDKQQVFKQLIEVKKCKFVYTHPNSNITLKAPAETYGLLFLFWTYTRVIIYNFFYLSVF